MWRALIVSAAVVLASPAVAEHGPAYPSDSNRGPAFPSSVSSTQSNPTNWVAPQTEYTDPEGANARWNRWYDARRRWEWR
jgi:hypothetical protein